MVHLPESVQPIRAAVFESDHGRVRQLNDQLLRLGGLVMHVATNRQNANALLGSGLVNAMDIDVAFIGSVDESGGQRVLNQLQLQRLVRTEMGPHRPTRRGYAKPERNLIVTAGIDTDPTHAETYGFHSEYLGRPLMLDWSQPDIGLPAVLLEVMHLKPVNNPNAGMSVHVPYPR